MPRGSREGQPKHCTGVRWIDDAVVPAQYRDKVSPASSLLGTYQTLCRSTRNGPPADWLRTTAWRWRMSL